VSLESLFDRIDERVPFSVFPGLRRGEVPGHAYEFLRGECAGRPLILQCGRLHLYEGFDLETVVRTVEILRNFGVRTVLFTAAAGGLRPEIGRCDLVGIERMRLWRYAHWNATPGMLFTDFVLPDCDFLGTYQWVHGPCYETRAEIAAIQSIKAEAVGMSTAPELAHCHELGMHAGLVACVTNSCCHPGPLTHAEVVAAARKASARLAHLIRKWLAA
jgi:purine-nucleoside phosphorylase